MEIYANGTVLDEYGRLSEAGLDRREYEPFTISAQDFERAWIDHKPMNR